MDHPDRHEDYDYSHDRQFRRQVERDVELRHDVANLSEKHLSHSRYSLASTCK